MRETLKNVWSWIAQWSTIGISAVLAAGLVSIAFAALDFSDVPANVTSGSQISASSWNDLAYRVNKSVKQASQVITVSWQNVGIGTASPTQPLSVSGVVESTSGGFKFPDGSVQTTSSTSAGKVVNVTTRNDCTRTPLTAATSVTLTSFTVDKKQANSALVIQGSISGHGNYSGEMTQAWKIGTSIEAVAQGIMYDENPYGKVIPTMAVIPSHTVTWPQTMTFRYYSIVAWADRPFVVYNPNATDDGRLAQTCSTYTVWEISQ